MAITAPIYIDFLNKAADVKLAKNDKFAIFFKILQGNKKF